MPVFSPAAPFPLARHRTGPKLHDIQRDINGRPMHVGSRVSIHIGKNFAPEEAEKQGLQNIFSIFIISCYPVRDPVDKGMIFVENPLKILGQRPAGGAMRGESQRASPFLNTSINDWRRLPLTGI